MGIICTIAGHRWNGCACGHCGAKRDEGHEWNGCTCRVCGRHRSEGHDWDGCKCKICGHTRPHKYNEDGFCKNCGAGQVNIYSSPKIKTVVRLEPCARCGKPTPHMAVICNNPTDPNYEREYRSGCIPCGSVPFCKRCGQYVSVTTTRNEYDGAESSKCDLCGSYMEE